MAQKLETFARRNGFRLVFTQTIREKCIISRRGRNRTREQEWACDLLSPFFEGSISYKRGRALSGIDNSVGGTLLSSAGKTRKEARGKFVAKIRGTTLTYGFLNQFSVKVPNNIR